MKEREIVLESCYSH